MKLVVLVGALIGVLLGVLLLAPAAAAQTAVGSTTLVLGAGAVGGTYYPVARALCRAIDRDLRAERLRCSAEATAGSVYNLQRLQAGEFDFAMAQADVQYAAMNGQGAWAGRPFTGLRAIAPLFGESFVIVAAHELAARGLEGLRGRRLHAGAPGSGTRATWDALAEALAWPDGGLPRLAEGASPAEALCERRIDAVASVTFHPSRVLARVLVECNAGLMPVEGAVRDRLIARHPYFRPGSLPGTVYPGTGPTETFSVGTDLVTTQAMDAKRVALLARVLAQNLEDLRAELPALASGVAVRHATPIAPLHPGAAPPR
jgi:TRAP transporter TAXI family solute receptor